MGRWDPKPFNLGRADDDPEQAPDPDDDPPAVHYREQLDIAERQLAGTDPETEPDRHARLIRESDGWRRLLEGEQRDEHWQAGAGDRTLFDEL